MSWRSAQILVATVLSLAVAGQHGSARQFGDVFSDSTVRVDYIFGGTSAAPSISLVSTTLSPGWAGRTARTDRLLHRGNAQLSVTPHGGSDTIYQTSFSTLYHEWLALGDTVARAYEVSLLMPCPKDKADVALNITDARGNVLARHKFVFETSDILVRRPTQTPNDTIQVHTGTYSGNRIQVAILPEGFVADSMDVFYDAARKAAEAILAHEPFKTYADRFDFIAVNVPSSDNGVSVPKKGVWADTPFKSHFSTFYSDRYLTTPRVFAVHDALSGIPYEHIIILANTDVYGGGGIYNAYTLTSTGHSRFAPVVTHEFGHSFGGLADEYFYDNDVMTDTYPLDVEPWEPNITTLVNFDSKWKSLIPAGTPCPTPVADAEKYAVGLFEGGGYSKHGIYRPADVCRMRNNTAPGFCPACVDALKQLILFYTEP